jgi:hypothetical protein
MLRVSGGRASAGGPRLQAEAPCPRNPPPVDNGPRSSPPRDPTPSGVRHADQTLPATPPLAMKANARRGPRARRDAIPALILIIILCGGLGSAIAIFLKAGHDRVDAGGYEIVNGQVYPVNPAETGQYRHDLEL